MTQKQSNKSWLKAGLDLVKTTLTHQGEILSISSSRSYCLQSVQQPLSIRLRTHKGHTVSRETNQRVSYLILLGQLRTLGK